MKSHALRNFVMIVGLIPMIVSRGCDTMGMMYGGIGTLEGKISIGPLCPVERIPPDPACQPTAETYKAYPVSVYSADMKNRIADLKPSLDGSFRTSIPSGSYVIALDRQLPGAGGSNLPVTVVIKEGSVTEVTIDIDTGIR